MCFSPKLTDTANQIQQTPREQKQNFQFNPFPSSLQSVNTKKARYENLNLSFYAKNLWFFAASLFDVLLCHGFHAKSDSRQRLSGHVRLTERKLLGFSGADKLRCHKILLAQERKKNKADAKFDLKTASDANKNQTGPGP